jgi:hypothetical protein
MVGPTSILVAVTSTLVMAVSLVVHWRRAERQQESTRPANRKIASPPWWVMPDPVRDPYPPKPQHNA